VDVAAEDALRPEAHRPADRQADPRDARQFAGDLHGRLAGPDYDHALAAKRVLRPVLRRVDRGTAVPLAAGNPRNVRGTWRSISPA
jgi:hypothetical protein